ncbi:MAG: GNAT family N-acetyltransferase [Alphaproteobacteria bacterium]|nr:GNAT family N-acetyltransferase [Alphaproteobacteria bacterium]
MLLPDVVIRDAGEADCIALGQLRARCITQLCSPDHHNDPNVLAAWIGDAGPDKFRRLLGDSSVRLLVAEVAGRVVGVCALAGNEITLNYIEPDCRLRGISKGMMAALEALLVAKGIGVARLYSTVTAVAFYRSLGWVEVGSAPPEQGVPMQKRL